MAKTPWQQRIRRAEYLAAEHAFAEQILGFYIHVARFQEAFYQRLERGKHSPGGSPAVEQTSRAFPGPDDDSAHDPELLAGFHEFLAVVEQHGPERVRQLARELRDASGGERSDLLHAVWAGSAGTQVNPEYFLAFAFLQPYAEFVRSRARLQLEGYTHSLCPFCNRPPALGVLRQLGDGGRRSLICGFCLTEWEFRRIVCPGCGQEDHAKLPVYTAETFPYIRVECCDTCQTYIKSVNFTKNGLADPLVDELASVPLNLWAQERGYKKLNPNLLGM